MQIRKRENLEDIVDIQQISTENQVADILTKPLAKFRLNFYVNEWVYNKYFRNNKGKC